MPQGGGIPSTGLADGTLPSSIGSIYTPPESRFVEVHFCHLVNTGVSSESVRLYVLSSGVSREIARATLEAGESLDAVEGGAFIPLAPGQVIQGVTSNPSVVSYFVGGVVA